MKGESGLQGLLDHAFGLGAGSSHVTQFGTGNLILGGDGSDIILGRGGDDIIDGDAWLNVRVSVRENIDGTGAEIASFDSLAPMIPLMVAGKYNPGQLVAVREILPGSGGFDTAVYQGSINDYTIAINDGGLIPIHQQVTTWATKKGIAYIPRTDERTHAYEFIQQ